MQANGSEGGFRLHEDEDEVPHPEMYSTVARHANDGGYCEVKRNGKDGQYMAPIGGSRPANTPSYQSVARQASVYANAKDFMTGDGVDVKGLSEKQLVMGSVRKNPLKSRGDLLVRKMNAKAGTLDEPASSKPGWQYIDPKTLRGVKEH
eukprot:m.112617 g.112617  ORF g.112617 m.112617 type:complete len:149 (-) comp13483_c0_seq9:299-745(-)